jgi:tRNA pseudouridine55 synthase
MPSRTDAVGAPHGLLLVDKPAGVTSAGVVARVKRMLHGAKVGHLGTLDPFATGLLPICVGEGTKLAPFVLDATKHYVGEIVLGSETDTLDGTGTVTATRPVPRLLPADLARAVAGLRGDIEQTPPMYSALKRDGVPLYRLARKGQEVARAPRPIRIGTFDLAIIGPERLAFAVVCSKGTYVRVLAQDLGRALGTGAHLAVLRRTASGPLAIADAVTLEALAPLVEAGRVPLLAPAVALGHLRAIVVDGPTATAIRRGQQQALARLGPPRAIGEQVRIESDDGTLVAIGEDVPDAGWRLARVMNEGAF